MKTFNNFFTTSNISEEVEQPKNQPPLGEAVFAALNFKIIDKVEILAQEIKNLASKDEAQQIAMAIVEHVEELEKTLKKEIEKTSKSLIEKNNALQKKLNDIGLLKEEEERKNKAFVYDSIFRQDEKTKEVLSEVSQITEHKISKIENHLKGDFQNQLEKLTQSYNEELEIYKSAIEGHEKEIQTLQESLKTFIKESKSYFNDEKYVAINKKIYQLEEILEKFNEKTILVENVLSAPPSIETNDPLTPLDQNFVTHEQLVKHYQLFINRIQQQLTTLGGGGAAWLNDLQDVNYNAVKSATDGQVLTYNAANALWEASTVSGSGGGDVTTADLTTANVIEVTNLYFTNARAIAAITEQENFEVSATNSALVEFADSSNNSTFFAQYDELYLSVLADSLGTDLRLNNLGVTISDGAGGSSNLTVIGSVTANVLTVTGQAKFNKVIESYSGIVNPTGAATFDCSNTHIFNVSSLNSNFTANFTNLDLDNSEATSLTLVLNQGASAYIANVVQIGGVTQNVKWQANAEPSGNVNAVDIQTFSILNVGGSYTVLGQLTTFG